MSTPIGPLFRVGDAIIGDDHDCVENASVLPNAASQSPIHFALVAVAETTVSALIGVVGAAITPAFAIAHASSP